MEPFEDVQIIEKNTELLSTSVPVPVPEETKIECTPSVEAPLPRSILKTPMDLACQEETKSTEK